ncbi:VOC family protein [Pseudomonas gingeri]|uniref:VOC family protein n=1 Tax=Pseudomonas gingeri TaxID=117681 RepID=A0A7Y8C1Z0_9PSED|nr:VOC family protein [Pseudomonas gingeri]
MIKILDVESVRFSAPDLQQMKAFLMDFGMVEADDLGDGVLRMRGTGTAPFIHETVVGEPGFRSLSLLAADLSDLEKLANSEGLPIEAADGPGGGKRVRLTDPDGWTVDVVAGKQRVEPLPSGYGGSWNDTARKIRPGTAKRVSRGSSHVFRLGHVVLGVSNVTQTTEWWQSRFGLIVSDEVRAPSGDLAAVFIRCDRGIDPADHHSLNFASVPDMPPRFHHAAFEVADLDDLMAGHELLKSKGYRHDWGVGRHVLGSQVFDYWRDPWGHRIEHWTDGDIFTADAPTAITDIPTMMGHHWGENPPADFVS